MVKLWLIFLVPRSVFCSWICNDSPSVASWEKFPHPSYFMKSPILHVPSFLRFCPTPLPLFCCLVSLAKCGIMPHSICYYVWWYYGLKLVESWYLSTNSTLLHFVQQNIDDMVFACALIWSHTQTNTHKDTWGPIDRHTHMCVIH